MTSLVTGCAGFIGSHLTERLLKEGEKVIGVDCFTDYYSRSQKEDNMSSFVENEDFTFIGGDLLDIDLSFLEDVDYVFHQAAQAGVRFSWGQSFHIYTKNNIRATQRLLEFCKDCFLEKFVFASSSSVYGDCPDMPMHEDSLLKPVSPYGVTKLASENLCYLYWKNFSIPTLSLRYFTVYGPRQRPDMAFHKFFSAIKENKVIQIYGDGEQTRDFTFVSDVVDANFLASQSDLEGETFNIGGGSNVTLNEVLDLMAEVSGKDPKTKHVKEQKGDMRHTHASINKAGNVLNYNPKVDLKEGLKKEWDWLK